MFEFMFIAGTIGFLVVYGIVLVWQEKRIRRLEDGSWRVGTVPRGRRRRSIR